MVYGRRRRRGRKGDKYDADLVKGGRRTRKKRTREGSFSFRENWREVGGRGSRER